MRCNINVARSPHSSSANACFQRLCLQRFSLGRPTPQPSPRAIVYDRFSFPAPFYLSHNSIPAPNNTQSPFALKVNTLSACPSECLLAISAIDTNHALVLLSPNGELTSTLSNRYIVPPSALVVRRSVLRRNRGLRSQSHPSLSLPLRKAPQLHTAIFSALSRSQQGKTHV